MPNNLKPTDKKSAKKGAIAKALERFIQDLPRFIYIEPTNLCNLHCPICPTGRGDAPGPKGFMKLDLFRRILEGARRSSYRAEILFLHKDGEPLLHPDIVEMVRLAKEAAIAKEVAFATNAALLDESVSKGLIAAGLGELYVSIESLDPARYAEIRAGAEIESVIANVRRFIELKGGKGRGPRLVIATINLGCSAPDVVRIFDEWRDMADRVQVVERYGWAGRYNEELPRARKKRVHPCASLWYLMAITWRGEVNLCCLDAGSTHPIADLHNETIPQIWRGEQYRRLRQLHLQGKFSGISLCRNCIDGDIPWIEKALSEITEQ